ncbi:hypothetical protein MBCUT_08910 [Methanobrevibacter cuticularis]|uniref:Uncharacterized protein n=1 Tax=Methanobrevibacter cuticularis TaxID=47311 RepID=A0A166E6Q8_9EURY|nr:hypothetical protein [Methanobrevibacter cuticularis]KZX16339.1 hypothetical protein MBCUT_08910 [Methanobrevibacter cuticularis]
MDTKKWLENRYIFFEEIYEYEEIYCLEFCLKEDIGEFIKICYRFNVPFTFYSEYKIAIEKIHVESLIDNIK